MRHRRCGGKVRAALAAAYFLMAAALRARPSPSGFRGLLLGRRPTRAQMAWFSGRVDGIGHRNLLVQTGWHARSSAERRPRPRQPAPRRMTGPVGVAGERARQRCGHTGLPPGFAVGFGLFRVAVPQGGPVGVGFRDPWAGFGLRDRGWPALLLASLHRAWLDRACAASEAVVGVGLASKCVGGPGRRLA